MRHEFHVLADFFVEGRYSFEVRAEKRIEANFDPTEMHAGDVIIVSGDELTILYRKFPTTDSGKFSLVCSGDYDENNENFADYLKSRGWRIIEGN